MSERKQIKWPPGIGFLPLVVGLIVWQLFMADSSSPYFPPPLDWYHSIVDESGSSLVSDLFVTVKTWMIGLTLALVVGTVLGLALGSSRLLHRMLNPILEFLRVLPSPVILPVIALVLGYGQVTSITLVAFASVWPILLNTAMAARTVDSTLRETARTLGLSRLQEIVKILLPHTVPSIVIGLRVAAPIALILTILAEMLSPNAGIGALLMQAQTAYKAAQAFGLLVVVGIVGYALNSAVNGIERLILRNWPKEELA